jgi:hypothetical protein
LPLIFHHFSQMLVAHACVILATQDAEIRRIVVQSQPGENNSRDPFSKNPSEK